MVVAEPMTDLQARFRRLEIVGPDVASRVPDRLPAAWIKVERPASTVVQVVHNRFASAASAEADVRAVFGNATVKLFPMSLREIFLVHSSMGRVEAERSHS
jgi:hypothetical protein